MKIDYNILTAEQLEEYAEFIDWSRVSSKLLTEKVNKSFGFLPQFAARLWFEDILSQMIIKEDQKKYPNFLLFFIGEEWYMDLDLKNGFLWCSDKKIWSAIHNKTNHGFSEIQLFIQNVMKQHYDIAVIPWSTNHTTRDTMEAHFKDLKPLSKERIILKDKIKLEEKKETFVSHIEKIWK